MKKFLLSLLLASISILGFSQDVVTTTASINLREGSSQNASVLTVIPQGEKLEVQNCQSEWCETSYNGQTGYVNHHYLKYPQGTEIKVPEATATSPVKYYTNSKGNTIQSPTQYDKQPAGATAQCRDGSYSFSQNHRGTCSHHGGVSRWL